MLFNNPEPSLDKGSEKPPRASFGRKKPNETREVQLLTPRGDVFVKNINSNLKATFITGM